MTIASPPGHLVVLSVRMASKWKRAAAKVSFYLHSVDDDSTFMIASLLFLGFVDLSLS